MSKRKEKSALQQEIDNYNAVNSFCMLIGKKLNNDIKQDYFKAENEQFFVLINQVSHDKKEPSQ